MNCYNHSIKRFDLLVAEDTEFNLTRNRVYVARNTSIGNLIEVVNDEGTNEIYSTEFFRFYKGETIDGFNY